MMGLSPVGRGRPEDEFFFPQGDQPTLHAALALQLVALMMKAVLKVSQTANDNTRRTLQEHLEGHRRNEQILEKCRQSYQHNILKAEFRHDIARA